MTIGMKVATQFQMKILEIGIQFIGQITRVWLSRPQRDAIVCVGRLMETYTEFEAVHVRIPRPQCSVRILVTSSERCVFVCFQVRGDVH